MRRLLIAYTLLLFLALPFINQNGDDFFEKFYGNRITAVDVYLKVSASILDENIPVQLVSEGFNEQFSKVSDCENIYLAKTVEKLENPKIAVKREFLPYLEGFYIFNGEKDFFYKKTNDFTELKNQGNEETAYLSFPKNLAHQTNGKVINDRGIGISIRNYLFNFFSLAKYYTHYLLIIFVMACVFLWRQDKELLSKINLFFNKYFKIIALLILALALYLRLIGIGYAPFCYDEYFSVNLGGNYKDSYMNIFMDPGNPPFFYLLMRLWEQIVPLNTGALRLLSMFFSFLIVPVFGYMIWLVSKEKTATAGAMFLLAIHPTLVTLGLFLRGYSLLLLCGFLITVFTYKIVYEQKRNFKIWFLYTILGVICINTHYYGALILIVNGLFLFLHLCFIQKSLRAFWELFCSYLVIGSSFLPFFFFRTLPDALLNKSFNLWMKPFSLQLFIFESISAFSELKYFLFLAFCFAFFYFEKKYISCRSSVRFLIHYCIFSISVLLLLVIDVSLLRNIYIGRYLIVFYAYLLPLAVLFLLVRYKKSICYCFALYLFFWTCTVTSSAVKLFKMDGVLSAVVNMVAFDSLTTDKYYHFYLNDILKTDNSITVTVPENMRIFDRIKQEALLPEAMYSDPNARLLFINVGLVFEYKYFHDQSVCRVTNTELSRYYSIVKNNDSGNPENIYFITE